MKGKKSQQQHQCEESASWNSCLGLIGPAPKSPSESCTHARTHARLFSSIIIRLILHRLQR